MDDKHRIAAIEGETAAASDPATPEEDGHAAAALAAVEILIWQLVRSGSVRAAPLALELERYARLHDSERRAPGDAAAAESLFALARLVRGAARACAGGARRRAPRPLFKDSYVH